MIQELTVDELRVRVYENRSDLGGDAANCVAQKINDLLAGQEFANIIFAAAPSQNEFLSFLSQHHEIKWNRINAFQMDEYIGLEHDTEQLFQNFLKEKLFDKIPLHAVHYIDGSAAEPATECERYASLLNLYPPDITCMGIGVNTHIAFNDPHEANFNDPLKVKLVGLDPVSRQQQVDDGCFDQIDQVPLAAITLTVPALVQANHIFCIVPGANKAQAVSHTLKSTIGEHYPSTILRKHPGAILFLDRDSSSKI